MEFAALKFDDPSKEPEEFEYDACCEMDHQLSCVGYHERAACSEPRYELEDTLLDGHPNRIVRRAYGTLLGDVPGRWQDTPVYPRRLEKCSDDLLFFGALVLAFIGC